MATPAPGRTVRLIDARDPARPFIAARLLRDCPADVLAAVESRWAGAREQASAVLAAAGLDPLEHEHWDWHNKIDDVERGRHLLVAVECEGEVQGVMAVARMPRTARLGDGSVVYVDYVEAAPWNLKAAALSPRFVGVGTALIVEAIRLSRDEGHGGRVGLHSLPQAETFYARCGMTRIGPDPDYHDLTYYEYTSQQAARWLTSIGELP